MMRSRGSRMWRRSLLLGGVALICGLTSGSCAAPFDTIGLVNSVRVISVDANILDTSTEDENDFSGGGSYARAGDTVRLTMTLFDGRETGGEPVTVVWLGGCFNPPGNQYYGCYEQLGELFGSLSGGGPPPEGLIGTGPFFDLTLPPDIVSEVPEPDAGERVGTAYVFFMACAGTIGPVDQEGDTSAGSFPIGCFDKSGKQLGAEAFVPGYTQVYAFEDERLNQQPEVRGLSWDGTTLEAGAIQEVAACTVSEEERKKSGCSAVDEFTECTAIELDLDVPDDVAEEDPGATDAEGNELREVVWVSYFASGGQFESETKLVSDAKEGIQTGNRTTRWVPPSEPGIFQIWAVARDNRGGSTTTTHTVTVTD